MIADRDNNRIISSRRASDRLALPAAGDLRPGQQFAGPDDAFLSPDGRASSPTRSSPTRSRASLARGPGSWSTGTRTSRAAPPATSRTPTTRTCCRRLIQVADIINCRVVWSTGPRDRALDRASGRVHARSADAALQPNGDTPLPDGGVLVTEIGGWVDRSPPRPPAVVDQDADRLPVRRAAAPNGNVLVAGFNTPGTSTSSPPGESRLDLRAGLGPGRARPPVARGQLPNGMIAATDDWNHRVVLIDRAPSRSCGNTGIAVRRGRRPAF